ncbi:Heavy metal transport/detoxification superfamily protein [Raphanus sativus]|uniref:Heavy metal-associated isoprenylated plant protein 15-like n=1 Tax=Raphanus sativus TaxID=3726 RepID=A0A9W3CEV1_RAPSA|nr:heavy metal-associated isoprenylated plant protein 15-like [Raphanus sativus]KAJ4877165.1 Heavy metal transport/detoxification superfamily protein [Raphanus sativus]
MKKMVVMMGVHDERSKRRIIAAVANFHGVTSITMDSKDGKLTVIGDFDSSKLLTKLEKEWTNAEMATFGPYDPKKEAETAAAAAEKKRMEEKERERLEVSRGNHSFNGPTPTHHQICLCNHDPYNGCIIS